MPPSTISFKLLYKPVIQFYSEIQFWENCTKVPNDRYMGHTSAVQLTSTLFDKQEKWRKRHVVPFVFYTKVEFKCWTEVLNAVTIILTMTDVTKMNSQIPLEGLIWIARIIRKYPRYNQFGPFLGSRLQKCKCKNHCWLYLLHVWPFGNWNGMQPNKW